MREVVLDTETTGLEPSAGHRIVEVGAVELVNHIPSGRRLPALSRPRARHAGGRRARARAHPATFSQSISASSRKRMRSSSLSATPSWSCTTRRSISASSTPSWSVSAGSHPSRSERTVDTLAIARRKYPGAPASLDALCKRFGIDRSAREKHGALLDAELLTDVYLELTGGRQPALGLRQAAPAPDAGSRPPARHAPARHARTRRARRKRRLTPPLLRR